MCNKSDSVEACCCVSTRRHTLKLAAGMVTSSTLVTNSVTAQTADRKKWSFETGGEIVSSPTVSEDTVFIGSDDENIYAVDIKSGEQEWRFETHNSVRTSPTVVDGTVFVGSGDYEDPERGRLYAIDAATGDRYWTFEPTIETESSQSLSQASDNEISTPILSSPTVTDGTVFVGSGGSEHGETIYAVDAETGKEQWAHKTNAQVDSSPIVVDNKVFIGSHDDTLYALHTKTGEEQWSTEIEFTHWSLFGPSPTVADGTVFIGSDDNTIYGMDIRTGNIEWTFDSDSDHRLHSSPTVADGKMFISVTVFNGYKLYAIDVDSGNKEWEFDPGQQINSVPTVADNTVFVGTQEQEAGRDDHFFALDADTGREKWAYETNGQVNSSPIVVNGTVYFGSSDNNLYALDAEIDGSSYDSRAMYGALGHHNDWHYSDQSLTMSTSVEDTDSQTSTDSIPGFGIGSGIAALGATGYILNRHLTNNS